VAQPKGVAFPAIRYWECFTESPPRMNPIYPDMQHSLDRINRMILYGIDKSSPRMPKWTLLFSRSTSLGDIKWDA